MAHHRINPTAFQTHRKKYQIVNFDSDSKMTALKPPSLSAFIVGFCYDIRKGPLKSSDHSLSGAIGTTKSLNYIVQSYAATLARHH